MPVKVEQINEYLFSDTVKSYLIHLQVINSVLMTLNSISFLAVDFSHNIAHLEQTVSNVYNWMSSNFLSLNPSKTEFLVIGLQIGRAHV